LAGGFSENRRLGKTPPATKKSQLAKGRVGFKEKREFPNCLPGLSNRNRQNAWLDVW